MESVVLWTRDNKKMRIICILFFSLTSVILYSQNDYEINLNKDTGIFSVQLPKNDNKYELQAIITSEHGKVFKFEFDSIFPQTWCAEELEVLDDMRNLNISIVIYSENKIMKKQEFDSLTVLCGLRNRVGFYDQDILKN